MELSNSEQERWEQIEAYLHGEFTAGQRASFEERMQSDTTLAREVEAIRSARLLVRHYGQREELKAIHQKILAERPVSPFARSGASFYLRIAAIIVFLIVAWAAIGLTTISPQSLVTSEYITYVPEITRAEAPVPSTVARQIKEEYLNANYAQVIQLYKNSPGKTIEESFLAGSAYLALQQPRPAMDCFKRVLALSAQENSYDFYQSAEYYMAWAYLQDNQLPEAFKLFDKIYRDSFHAHHTDLSRWFYWKLRFLRWKNT